MFTHALELVIDMSDGASCLITTDDVESARAMFHRPGEAHQLVTNAGSDLGAVGSLMRSTPKGLNV